MMRDGDEVCFVLLVAACWMSMHYIGVSESVQ